MDSATLTGNGVVNGVIGSGTTNANTSTFSAGDKIAATGSNNTLNIVDLSSGPAGTSLPGATTVSGVQTVNLTSGVATGTANFSGFTGLTTLNVAESGGAAGITAAATTAVNLVDSAAAATTINVLGGQNVAVTANGVTAGGTINVGSSIAAPAGTVTITENMLATQSGVKIADAINVTGGTTVTVNANLNELAGAGNTVTGGAIGVTGTASTTSVTVNQTAAATAAAATTAVPGVSQNVSAATAAPGVQAATAATQTAAVATTAAVAGVVDGAVTISDANASSTTATNTITSVSLANFGAGSAINDNALSSLSLTGGAGTLTLTNNAATPTNTALALSLNGVGSVSATTGSVTSVTFADAKNEITTLNVTTAGKDSYLTVTDTKLAAINVSGTNTLNLSTVPTTVKTITVSGSAGFNDGGSLASDTALTSFTTTSSGKITATLGSSQSFVGSTGQDVITISTDATKAITGGSATNNEIIFNAAATSFNTTSAKLTNANVTGFTTFGLGASASGTYDLSTFNSGFKVIDITAGNFAAGVSDSIVNAATGTSLNISGPTSGVTVGGTSSDAGTISVAFADTTGASDAVSLSIGSALPANVTLAGLTLADANGVGIGTLNVTTAGSDIGNLGGALDTITTLTDNGLSVLNVSGTAGLTIGGLNEASTQATSFTINSMESGQNGTTITSFTDANLGNLTFKGTAAADVATLTTGGATVTSLTIANSGTGTATVGDAAGGAGLGFGTTLKSLTLTGNVALGLTGTGAMTATGATTGFTLSGATDNAHVNINLSGAAAGSTDAITLGNGNNNIVDGSTAGKVNVTVGSGQNLIDVSGGVKVSGYAATVTLGAHTAADQVNVGTITAAATAANTTITGAVKGDILFIADATSVAQATTVQQTSISAAANLGAAINAADSLLTGTHGALAFQFGGNTYVLESAAAGAGATTAADTLVQITGAHTVSSTMVNTHGIVLAS
ncbi:beta strand repeat-containing protein [Paraburkholderia sp. DGU8]|uniref:beta strand repeat-containing protein n=1 Tax=Paraburkholderia sp. DGU8 TaxID=3161997 RepID=UPI003465C9C5